ncbi:hypothetical protein ElyMa_000948700 [Elysia marginata]|uniref:Spaetzle domain-containing protein n=1 Tax=Elysia marginata TaxID=1093978 RepID=A0AAV4HBQ2_9GAST|nr:hypothetical protein ElyMa_000948700 [Elysia marginata]
MVLLAADRVWGWHPDSDEQFVLEHYPGLFKTEEEVNRLLPKGAPVRPKVTKNIWALISSSRWTISTLKESLSLSVSLISDPETVYHGCCATNRTLTFFDTMTDKDKKSVKVVQYKEKKQYIETDSCVTTASCEDNCSCQKENRFYTALIYNPDYPGKSDRKYKLDLVQAKTICRCVNNGASGSPFPDRDEL